MKWTKQRTRVGAEGDFPGQPGPGRPPGDQYHGQSLRPRFVQIQHRRYGCAEPTPLRRGGVLLGVPAVLNRGNPVVFPERRQISASKRRTVVVHHWVLPRPQQRLNNRERYFSAEKFPPGSRTVVGGGF